MKMKLDVIDDISQYDYDAFRPDLRRDLHMYVDYVAGRDVKRGHRDNCIPKADARRLAKLMSDPEAEADVKESGGSVWLYYVDDLALQMQLVDYDTKGVYMGQSSFAPSYPDNYIEFNAEAYRKLTSLSLADQESDLLDVMLKSNQGCESEFYKRHALSRLDGFSTNGCAVGAMPMLDFEQIRQFLLDLLAKCPTGQWLSVDSLAAHLTKRDRYFLIPRTPKFKNKWDERYGRYGNFRESKEDPWRGEIQIADDDPDGFERVEGRYLERFLEGIPNLLGYVDVAYAKKPPTGIYPMRGYLKAFRVSQRLARALDRKIAEPTVRVTPNFEVYVQTELYPAQLLARLAPVCDFVSEQPAIVLRLLRQKVAAACAEDPKFDVVGLLESLTEAPLPDNVRRELSDWSAHGEKFTLYTNCSLLETSGQPIDLGHHSVERIAPGLDIVKSSSRLYKLLQTRELAPTRIKHGESSFAELPPKTSSVLRRKRSAKKKAPSRTKVRLIRATRVELVCPDEEFLQRLQRLLAEANCPVEVDRKRLTLSYPLQLDKEVNSAIRSLKKEFDIKVEDQKG